MSLGLTALFLSGFLAATLLPVGSEPVLLAYLTQQAPAAWWPTAGLAVIAVGTGNTLGGIVTYGMGRGVRYFWGRWRREPQAGKSTRARDAHVKARRWLDRWGPWALLLSWAPVVGDPLCAAAGAMRLPFWPCALAIAVGKFARYLVLTAAVLAIDL